MERFTPTERIGVNEVEKIFLAFGWIPRSVLQSDIGLDMEVEVCKEGKPTGQLFGVQIKSGSSYFKNVTDSNIVFRGTLVHLEYWLKHSLPIILILHNPETEISIWQKIEEDKIIRTEKGWKTEIPAGQVLNLTYKDEIEQLNKYPLYFQRLQRLLVHKELMQEIKDGSHIVVEVGYWCNKMIGRAQIKVKRIERIDEKLLLKGDYIYFDAVDSLYELFPWAEFEEDENFYDKEENELDLYSRVDYYDEDDTAHFLEEKETKKRNFRYIECGAGEIHFYRLVFSLNELGKSFLNLDEFLEN